MAKSSLFESESYKDFVNDRIRAMGRSGRGELGRIARALSVHPTLVSHIFRGEKELSMEQASLLCKYLDLSIFETDYFLLLVQRAKSGSTELSKILDRQIRDFQKRAKGLVNRVSPEAELSEEDKAVFYSNWYFSAIRLLTSIPGCQTRDKIARYTGLPLRLVQGTLEFLVAKGLCRYDGAKYSLGPALTHLEAGSRFISRQHTSWRLKVIEQHPYLTDNDLIFSGPLTISRNDAALVRERLIQFIQELGSTVKDSEAEELWCFNVDWVKVRGAKESALG